MAKKAKTARKKARKGLRVKIGSLVSGWRVISVNRVHIGRARTRDDLGAELRPNAYWRRRLKLASGACYFWNLQAMRHWLEEAALFNGKIVVLTHQNPRGQGTKRYRRYAKLAEFDGKPVRKFLDADGERSALRNAGRDGHVKIA
jgi:hypothetical protein